MSMRENRSFYHIFSGAALFFALAFCLLCVRADAAPSGYLLPDSSYEYITADRVAGWPSQALCYARNEIYARAGKTFQSRELQEYFDSQYWYHGIYSPDEFLDSMLNVYETANVATLLSIEKGQGEYILDQPGYSFDALTPYAVEGDASEAATESLADSFTVDPGSYIFQDSDRRVLTSSEIGQLTLQELCYAKNEIYARHGYIFSSTELSDYFNSKNWYWGTVDASAFSPSLLNYVEIQNIESFQAQEQAQGGYATDQPGYSYSAVRSFPAQAAATVSESDYIFYDSALRYLTDADVSGMSLQQLCYARNEIYARRGYIFQSSELREYFGSKPWYSPTLPADSFSESVFNEFEAANIALLKQHEYAINPNGYQLY